MITIADIKALSDKFKELEINKSIDIREHKNINADVMNYYKHPEFLTLNLFDNRINIQHIQRFGWNCEKHYVIGENYHNDISCTEQAEKVVIDFLNKMILNKEEIIEKQKNNPTFEDFAKMCEDYANSILNNRNNNCIVVLKYGNTQANPYDRHAIVIYDKDDYCKGNYAYGQYGYIDLGKTSFNQFTIGTKNSWGNITLVDWTDYKKEIFDCIQDVLGRNF